MRPLKFYLFSGFLGSGKTSLLLKLAKSLVEQKDKKVMLIVNDVGDIGVDAKLMREIDSEVYEIFGGCVCTQLSNLAKILVKSRRKHIADVVLMEASGIAQPPRFIDTIKRFLPEDAYVNIITLVDVSRWPELRQVVEEVVTIQVKSAEVILLNKIDLADEATIESILKDVKAINPSASILKICTHNEADIRKVSEVV